MNTNISKKTIFIVAVLLIAFVVIYAIASFAMVKSEINHFKKEISDINSLYADAKIGFITDLRQDSEYTLLEYNGKIGVYDSDSCELLEILDVYVITLPDSDQKMLEDGIDAASVKELISLVEDYTS